MQHFQNVVGCGDLGPRGDRAEHLERRIALHAHDLLDYAPVTKAHVPQGSMSVSALCAAAIEASDNTAANLLLNSLNGPAQVTRYVRSIGDYTTRLDRREPQVNPAIAGDPRDTTTPQRQLRMVIVIGRRVRVQ